MSTEERRDQNQEIKKMFKGVKTVLRTHEKPETKAHGRIGNKGHTQTRKVKLIKHRLNTYGGHKRQEKDKDKKSNVEQDTRGQNHDIYM